MPKRTPPTDDVPLKKRGRPRRSDTPAVDASAPSRANGNGAVTGNLGGTIKAIQDIMRTDVGVDGDAQRIGQLVWMLFLKIHDDREQELELIEDRYVSPIPKDLRWRNWAADPEGMTGDELLGFVNNRLFPALKELATTASGPAKRRALVVGGVFEDAYNYMKSGTLMRQVG